jgi:hypothetical protein
LGGNEGVLVIDTERWIPVQAQIGRLQETFGEFVQLDHQHYAPLKIRVEVGDTAYDWRFRVYAPGLWLFDDSFSDGRRLAWVEKVSVNSAEAKVEHATASSVALQAAAQIGTGRIKEFLDANRHWLLPSIEARRGLVYEYRQEDPYLERVIVDPSGNILARLESTKESPGAATRQQLRLSDGRSFSGDVTNLFVKLEPAPAPQAGAKAGQRDGLVQHLAMGLAIECALTKLAREPDQFWADVQPVENDPKRYLLVLRPKSDARLFTGTMLAFTSWAFMHDINYDRAEILCDAATHRPIEEKLYAGKNDLKGHYVFRNWLDDPSGSVPGLIQAVVPHKKDDKDQSLEMQAEFHLPTPGVWLLKKVESHFRGTTDASTGRISVIQNPGPNPPQSEALYAPIAELLERGAKTEKILASLGEAQERPGEVIVSGSEWAPIFLKAVWTEEARKSETERGARGDRAAQPVSLIGVYRARILEGAANSIAVELEGLSTASWKEFLSRWQVSLHDPQGRILATGATNLSVRAENGPTPFRVRLELPITGASGARPAQLLAEGTIERMTGAYHGHGMWMHFMQK